MKQVTILTDGSYKPKSKTGGWAAVMKAGPFAQAVYGGEKRHTSNNRMEMTAVVKSLSELKEPCKVHLISDSQYVLNGMNSWVKKWKKNGWKTSSGRDVENKDLWQKVDRLAKKHKVKTEWIKGHTDGDGVDQLGNAAADYLAGRGADEVKPKQKR